MTTLTVTNLRSIKSAVIEDIDHGITLVAGCNGAGKTSLATALRCAVHGTANPYGGRLGEEALARLMVPEGAEGRTEVVLGDRSIEWPSRKVRGGETAPIRASSIALGEVRFTSMSPAELSETLIDALDAKPTQEDVAEAVAGMGDAVDCDDASLVRQIMERGFDRMADVVEDEGKKLTGRWRQVTGEAYGIRKAEGWQPAGFVDLPAEELAERLTKAEAARDEAIANAALSGDEKQRLEDAVSCRGDADRELAEAKARLAATEEDIADIARDYAAAPSQVCATPDCPHCGAEVAVLADFSVTMPVSPEQRKLIDQAHRQIAERQQAAEAKRDEAQKRIRGAEATIASAEQASAKLASMKDRPGADVAAAKARADEARRAVDARKAHDTAARLHARIKQAAKLKELLDPKGLRLQALTAAVDLANKTLARMSESFGCEPVEIVVGDEIELEYAGRPIRAASESERWRVDVVLRILLAQHEGAGIVIVDGADVLDVPGREGLFKALIAAKLSAFVCMTVSSPLNAKALPDLRAARLGRTYWIEDGHAIDVGALRSEERAA